MGICLLTKELIHNAFNNAYNVRNRGRMETNNATRSAKFVYELAKLLYGKMSNNSILKVKKVDDEGIRSPGEWLLDVIITETLQIQNLRPPQSNAFIFKRILWAVECESAVGIRDFSVDFSKLLVVQSENCLYLNGLDQMIENIEPYISNRLQITENLLNSLNFRRSLYFGFWPSPKMRNGESLWDSEDQSTLVSKIKLYKWTNKNDISFGFEVIEK